MVERVPSVRVYDLKNILPRHPSGEIQTVPDKVVIEGQPVAIVRSWFGRGMTKLRFVCPDCNGGCYVLYIIKGKPVCRRCGELDYSSRRNRMTLRGLRALVCAELRRHGHEKEARSIECRRASRGL
jgi:hypothetical protein